MCYSLPEEYQREFTVWGFGLFLSADVEPKLRLSVWEQRARPCFLFWSQFLQLFQTKFGCSHGAIKTNFSFYPQNKIDSHYSSFSKWSFKLDSKTLDSIYFDKIYVRTWSVNSGLHLVYIISAALSTWAMINNYRYNMYIGMDTIYLQYHSLPYQVKEDISHVHSRLFRSNYWHSQKQNILFNI